MNSYRRESNNGAIIFGIIGLICTVLFTMLIVTDVRGSYEYSRTIGSYWDLSVKVSTLEAKGAYLDSFLVAVDNAKLSGNNAIIFPTPDNDVARNINALRTLQVRIHEARTMDPNGFAYQTAIQQITKQEQDDATGTIGEIEGRWWLDHHSFNWGWIGLLIGVITAAGAITGFGVAASLWD